MPASVNVASQVALAGQQIFDRVPLLTKFSDGGVDFGLSKFVVFKALGYGPGLAVAGQWHTGDEAFVDSVATVTADSGAECLAFWSREPDVANIVECGIGG